MAGRILNRRELRKQADAVSEPAADAAAAPEKPAKKSAKAKAPTAPKPRKAPRKKAPERFCARWGVFDSGMKQVAIFDYNQRPAAEEKVAALMAKKSGTFFLQLVKVPMPAAPEPVAT